MVSLADHLIHAEWTQEPAPRTKPPPCAHILAQMQNLIDDARTEKARAFYQRNLNLYLKATNHDTAH